MAVLVVTLGLGALAAVLVWRTWAPRPNRVASSRDAAAAYAEARRLSLAERHVESLAAYREALTNPAVPAEAHLEYATALLNAVHETREKPLQFVVRASPERVAMVREALIHLVAAERLVGAGGARTVAWARRTRAQAMMAWGFPWEAFAAYREAQWADSTWEEPALQADALMDLMASPAGAK